MSNKGLVNVNKVLGRGNRKESLESAIDELLAMNDRNDKLIVSDVIFSKGVELGLFANPHRVMNARYSVQQATYKGVRVVCQK